VQTAKGEQPKLSSRDGGITMTAISKITSKGQTTVPREVRAALNSEPGDLIAWDVEADGRVAVRRIQLADVEYLHAGYVERVAYGRRRASL